MNNDIIKELEQRLEEIYKRKYVGITLDDELLNIMISECEEIMYEMLLVRNLDPLTPDQKIDFDRGNRTLEMTFRLQTAFKALILS